MTIEPTDNRTASSSCHSYSTRNRRATGGLDLYTAVLLTLWIIPIPDLEYTNLMTTRSKDSRFRFWYGRVSMLRNPSSNRSANVRYSRPSSCMSISKCTLVLIPNFGIWLRSASHKNPSILTSVSFENNNKKQEHKDWDRVREETRIHDAGNIKTKYNDSLCGRSVLHLQRYLLEHTRDRRLLTRPTEQAQLLPSWYVMRAISWLVFSHVLTSTVMIIRNNGCISSWSFLRARKILQSSTFPPWGWTHFRNSDDNFTSTQPHNTSTKKWIRHETISGVRRADPCPERILTTHTQSLLYCSCCVFYNCFMICSSVVQRVLTMIPIGVKWCLFRDHQM